MKNIKFFSFLMIVATSLLFIQCTTDPIPGEDGQDGADGVDGQDGATGTTECAACHNISTAETVHSSYLFSGHAAGGAVDYAGNRNGCAQCHSSEGYIEYALMGATNAPYESPTPINCKTCHGQHKTFDFENDGYDFALRMPGPVTLITDDSYTINYENGSNNCAFCHQPRRTPPEDNGLGLFTITSSHWGPHHGPQSTMLEGIQGAEIDGSVDYPEAVSAAHRTGSSCVECHMAEPDGEGIDGYHTMIQTDTNCGTCHSNGIPDEVTGLEAGMLALGAKLEEIGIVHDGHPVTGTYKIEEAEAAWNYLLVMEDASKGIHNPKYAKALVANSNEVLSAD